MNYFGKPTKLALKTLNDLLDHTEVKGDLNKETG